MCVREILWTYADTTSAGIAAATMSAVLAASEPTPPDPAAISAWYQEHAFQTCDIPTLAQLRELVDP